MHADRMNVMGTETAFSVLAMAKELEAQGKKISHFEIGDPDFKTPQNIIEAAKKALDQGFTHYTPAPGLMELREAIAAHVSKTAALTSVLKKQSYSQARNPLCSPRYLH